MRAFAALFCLLLLSLAISAEVKGKWFTERESAMAEAQKQKKPILAVAMDHA